MRHTGTSEIPTPLKIAVRTHFHAQHDTKTTLVFLSVDGGVSHHYFQIQFPYYQAAQCNLKTPVSVSSR